jgi:hypothetical protein
LPVIFVPFLFDITYTINKCKICKVPSKPTKVNFSILSYTIIYKKGFYRFFSNFLQVIFLN